MSIVFANNHRSLISIKSDDNGKTGATKTTANLSHGVSWGGGDEYLCSCYGFL